MVILGKVKMEVERLFQLELRQEGNLWTNTQDVNGISFELHLHEFARTFTLTYEIWDYKNSASFNCSERIEYLGKVETFKDKVNALKALAAKYL